MQSITANYRGHRFPPEIISHDVWRQEGNRPPEGLSAPPSGPAAARTAE